MIPAISFVIPVRNDALRLRSCLQSIWDGATDVPIEIVVADNGSTDESRGVAEAAGARVLDLPGHPVSQLRNLAATQARSELLAFIDADHTLQPGWIATAVATMKDTAVWAAGAEYSSPPTPTWVQRIYDGFRSHPIGLKAVSWLPSGNLVVRRTAFASVHGFDEKLESCEDVDFCRRIRQAGGLLVSVDTLRSVHFGDPKTLKALFFSELWRGRDNIRVSLRERLTVRSAPSVLIPLANLLGLAVGIVGCFLKPLAGWKVAAIGFGIATLLMSLRAVRLLLRTASSNRSALDFPGCLLVAATYEIARALAIVLRVSHGVRRRG